MNICANLTLCALALVLLVAASSTAWGVPETPVERDDVHRWVGRHITGAPAEAPFSFVYGAQPSRAIMAGWHRVRR
jgi:hypothetical protein